jgi:hypothetical protein
VTGAALIVVGFFLPWLDGTAEFAGRDFSGFDFARLIRNLEVTAESRSEGGQLQMTALLLYLTPALAVNSAVLWLARSTVGLPIIAVAGASVAAGVYALAIMSALLFLSVVELNDFAGVVGAPLYGMLISVIGCAVLLAVGVAKWPTRHPERF